MELHVQCFVRPASRIYLKVLFKAHLLHTKSIHAWHLYFGDCDRANTHRNVTF